MFFIFLAIVDEFKLPYELKVNITKPKIDKPNGDLKPKNSQREVVVVMQVVYLQLIKNIESK
jgi:hypothetical protein